MSLKRKPAKRLIGYARVSTQQQDLARQTKALKRLGCAPIYSDTASGKSMAGRPQLARALDDLDTGDELVIAKWDRRHALDVGRFADHQNGDRRRSLDQGARPELYRPHHPYGAGFHGHDVCNGRGRTLADHQARPRRPTDWPELTNGQFL